MTVVSDILSKEESRPCAHLGEEYHLEFISKSCWLYLQNWGGHKVCKDGSC